MTEERAELIRSWPPGSSSTDVIDLTDHPPKRQKSSHVTQSQFVQKEPVQPRITVVHSPVKLEPLADVLLSRWWRKHGRRLVNIKSWPSSDNPNTMLSLMVRTEPCRDYMRHEITRLRTQLSVLGNLTDLCVEASIHASLASMYFMLNQLNEANTHIQSAVKLKQDDCRYQSLFHRIARQVTAASKQFTGLKTINGTLVKTPNMSLVRRVHADDLSMFEFFSRHALTSKPVIITGLAERLTPEPWTLDYIKERAGSNLFRVKQRVEGSVDWAGLENAEMMTVGQYIERLQNYSSAKNEADKRYLFDWSLPQNCPALAREVTIPKYFAGDFLQRTDPGSLYRDSWPSLFISPANITSQLHIDSFGSNFWMALFKGQKRWTFFDKADIPFLYPQYHSIDPIFEVNCDNPDLGKYPLYSMTHPNVCVLTEGDVLFVPGGCPHMVESLTESIAISANYVDLSNHSLTLKEIEANSEDERAADLLKQMKHADFQTSMSSHQKDLKFEQFKKWPRDDDTQYDITSS